MIFSHKLNMCLTAHQLDLFSDNGHDENPNLTIEQLKVYLGE